MKSFRFDNTDDDPRVYYNENRNVIIVLFVDDGFISGTSQQEMFNILNKLKEFEIPYDTVENDKILILIVLIQHILQWKNGWLQVLETL